MLHKVHYFEYYEPAESLKEKAIRKELLEKIAASIKNTSDNVRAKSFMSLTDVSTGGVLFLGQN